MPAKSTPAGTAAPSPLNRRTGVTPGTAAPPRTVAPASAAQLLPDDPNEVPGITQWTRPTPPASGHTERLVAGLAAVLAQMQQTAKRATGTLTSQSFTGFAPGHRPQGTNSLRLPGFRHFWWTYLLLLTGGVMVVITATRVTLDTWDDVATRLQYGQIRTSHLTVFFGVPEESPTTPSIVTAVNDHGTARIFVLPGGQGTHASYVEIPINGDPDGKLPLLLQAVDIDRDGHPDLLIQWGANGPINRYLFDTGKMSLRPPTAEEQQRLYLPTPGTGQ